MIRRAFFLDDEERARLVDLIRRVSRFSGVKLLAYGVMSNRRSSRPNSSRRLSAVSALCSSRRSRQLSRLLFSAADIDVHRFSVFTPTEAGYYYVPGVAAALEPLKRWQGSYLFADRKALIVCPKRFANRFLR